ncbi:MAG: hypothetical protein AAGJ83_15955, partial [Planctomycetota bacterium]
MLASFDVRLMAAVATLLVILISCFAPAVTTATSLCVVGVCAWVAHSTDVGLWWGTAALAAGFLGQEFAHWFTGEVTYQSTYRREVASAWWVRWIEHTVLLIPAIITVASRRRQSPLRLLVARRAVLQTKLTRDGQRSDFHRILRWVRKEKPTITSSTHWWQHD